MAVTTAVREGVRKRAIAAGKTPTTTGINATVAKYRAPVVVPPPQVEPPVSKVPEIRAEGRERNRERNVADDPRDLDQIKRERVAARIDARIGRPGTGVPSPNAQALANANPNARFKRSPEATAWGEGLRTAMKAARGAYTTANPKPEGVKKGIGRRRRGRAKK